MKQFYLLVLVFVLAALACSSTGSQPTWQSSEPGKSGEATAPSDSEEDELDNAPELPAARPTLPEIAGGDCSKELGPGLDLAKCEFSSMNAEEADLSGANLAQAKISHSNFQKVNFTNASLNGAFISHTSLSGSDFTGANLALATLDASSLHEANFTCADLSWIIASEIAMLKANFTDADLTNADMSGSNLIEADFTGAITVGVDFSGSIMTGAIITDEQLDQALSVERTILPDGSIGN